MISYTGKAILPKVSCPKISDIFGTPFVLYITEIFLPKNFGHIVKFGNIAPELFPPCRSEKCHHKSCDILRANAQKIGTR
jgi:hypothetical protein